MLIFRGNRRIFEVLSVLFFCSYEYLEQKFPSVALFFLKNTLFRKHKYLLKYPPPQRLRVALEKLGAAYVKIGQLLSTRVDILTPEFIKELEKLQDNVPPAPLEEIKKVLGSLSEEFVEFDPQPIGSGSIAQVHRAVLKNGEEVAVKVLKPGVEREVKKDIEILKKSIELISKFTDIADRYNLKQIVNEVSRFLLNEFDLIKEAAYLEMFRKLSEEDKNLYIPKVYWDYTQREVLVTEFIRAKKLIDYLKDCKCDRKKLADKFVKIVLKQIFELGVFHGDLHPGNIFMLEGERFAFVDFGITGRLSPDAFSAFFMFSYAAVRKDVDMIYETLKYIGAVKSNTDEKLFKRELLVFLDKYYNLPLSKINAEKFFYEELAIARQFNVVLPEELLLLMKAVAHTESLARVIYPHFTLPPLLKPFLQERLTSFAVHELKRKTAKLLFAYSTLAEEIPKRFEQTGFKSQKERDSKLPVVRAALALGFCYLLAVKPELSPIALALLFIVKE